MKIAGSGWYAAPNDLYGSGLTPYEIAVMGYLYRRAGADGASIPAARTIAADCGMSERQARMTMNGLVSKGRVAKRARTDARGRSTSNEYVLVHPPQDVGGTLQEVPPHPAPPATSTLHVVQGRSTEVPRNDEVPLREEGGRIAPPARSDAALQAARQFISQAARDLARGAADRFGWPPTPYRLGREARLAQELLDVGIPPAFLQQTIDTRTKLGTLEWLHRDLDLRKLQEMEQDDERQRLVAELVDRYWKDGAT